MPRQLALSAALCLALATSACLGDSSPAEPERQIDLATVQFAPELAVNIAAMTRTASGVYYQDLVVGSGAAAAPTDSVGIFYSGYVSSGRLFDASDRVVPHQQRLGRGLPGFTEGASGMRVGGQRKIVIPPNRAYGAQNVRDQSGAVVIPANSVLVFDVRLVALY